jgi:hypothetical protein
MIDNKGKMMELWCLRVGVWKPHTLRAENVEKFCVVSMACDEAEAVPDRLITG